MSKTYLWYRSLLQKENYIHKEIYINKEIYNHKENFQSRYFHYSNFTPIFGTSIIGFL